MSADLLRSLIISVVDTNGQIVSEIVAGECFARKGPATTQQPNHQVFGTFGGSRCVEM